MTQECFREQRKWTGKATFAEPPVVPEDKAGGEEQFFC